MDLFIKLIITILIFYTIFFYIRAKIFLNKSISEKSNIKQINKNGKELIIAIPVLREQNCIEDTILKNKGLIECDVFLLLTADYNTICERNKTRNHILEGIWLEEETIVNQRQVLEKMTNEIVGSISKNIIKKKILDTSNLTKEEVLDEFNELLNNWERDELEMN